MFDLAAALLAARPPVATPVPEAAEHLLSGMLQTVRLHGVAFHWVDAVAPCAAVPGDPAARFHVVVDGSCRPGWDGPATARFVCGFVACDAGPFNPLLQCLPRMLRVPFAGGPAAGLAHRAAVAAAAPCPGKQAPRVQLAESLLMAAACTHLARLPAGTGGWLGGVRDPFVGRALGLLHACPARRWTAEALAAEMDLPSCMLAERFAAFAGHAPMPYLARWRVQLAASRLLRGGERIAAIALDVGYESEAAFTRAFRRLAGMPPAAWRRAQMVRARRAH